MYAILGGSGYVGAAFAHRLDELGESYKLLTRKDCDFLNEAQLREVLEGVKPEFVINAAGYVGRPNVDACEANRTDCVAGNAVLPGTVAKVCDSLGIPWGYVSSGCIFLGRTPNGNPFNELHVPNFSFRQNNCSFYSGCKALGEEALGYHIQVEKGTESWVSREEETGYIWRLRIPFNNIPDARNYLQKIIAYDTLLDVENSFSNLEDFVDGCIQCWKKKVPFGIYNVTNQGSLTTRQVTEMIIAESKRRESNKLPNPFPGNFNFFKNEAEFMKKAAITPRSSCVLDTDKLRSAGIEMRSVESAMKACLEAWQVD